MALDGSVRSLVGLDFREGSGRLWPKLWLVFSSSGFIYMLLDSSGPF